MKFNVFKDDPAVFGQYEVFLNGEFQELCVEVDDELGFIRRYVVVDGELVVEGDGYQIETMQGRVDIRLKKPKLTNVVKNQPLRIDYGSGK